MPDPLEVDRAFFYLRFFVTSVGRFFFRSATLFLIMETTSGVATVGQGRFSFL